MAQVEKGWMCAPAELAISGTPEGHAPGGYNAAFRLVVGQASKLRACDDPKQCLANQPFVAETPTHLVSLGSLAQLCKRSRHGARDWARFKADQEADYRQRPPLKDRRIAIIAMREPSTGRRFGLAPSALMFGATAADLRYDVFSRTVADISDAMMGIPLLCFFDDFPALAHQIRAREALGVFDPFCSLLVIPTKPTKSEVGNDANFLGHRGFFPCRRNSYRQNIPLPTKKRHAWKSRPGDYIQRQSISPQELEKQIGEMSFPKTPLFGMLARTQLRPL